MINVTELYTLTWFKWKCLCLFYQNEKYLNIFLRLRNANTFILLGNSYAVV